jgi:hypothetical protein
MRSIDILNQKIIQWRMIMKTTINFNKKFRNWRNEEMSGDTQSDVLAEYLANANSNRAKFMSIATDLAKNGSVELDNADIELIKRHLEDCGAKNFIVQNLMDTINAKSGEVNQ